MPVRNRWQSSCAGLFAGRHSWPRPATSAGRIRPESMAWAFRRCEHGVVRSSRTARKGRCVQPRSLAALAGRSHRLFQRSGRHPRATRAFRVVFLEPGLRGAIYLLVLAPNQNGPGAERSPGPPTLRSRVFFRPESSRKPGIDSSADRFEAEAWSIRMEGYGGPAQPSPTIGQCLNGGYGWLEIECCRY